MTDYLHTKFGLIWIKETKVTDGDGICPQVENVLNRPGEIGLKRKLQSFLRSGTESPPPPLGSKQTTRKTGPDSYGVKVVVIVVIVCTDCILSKASCFQRLAIGKMPKEL